MGRLYKNEEVFQRVREERNFPKALKIRRAKLMGLIQRHNNLLGRIIVETIERKNIRERSLFEYISYIYISMIEIWGVKI